MKYKEVHDQDQQKISLNKHLIANESALAMKWQKKFAQTEHKSQKQALEKVIKYQKAKESVLFDEPPELYQNAMYIVENRSKLSRIPSTRSLYSPESKMYYHAKAQSHKNNLGNHDNPSKAL